MVGTPTSWTSGTEHLGRRKPEAALALAEARARSKRWGEVCQQLKRALSELADRTDEEAKEASHKAGTMVPIGIFVPRVSSDTPHPSRQIAFVSSHLASRANALALAAPKTDAASIRLCASQAPDAIRCALAGLGDLRDTVAWICMGDVSRKMFAERAGFTRVRELPADDSASIFSPASLALGSLRGADLKALGARLSAAFDDLNAKESAAPADPFSIGALLAGLANRKATQAVVTGPEELRPLLAWIESAAANLAPDTTFTLIAHESIEEPERYPIDRWLTNYLVADSSPERTHRARRLIGAGVPLIQLELASFEKLAHELIRWELALSFAANAPPARSKHDDDDGLLPADHEAALRDGPLAIYAATANHAYILRKVAGTLGKKAETSLPAWIAAQAAMGDSGEYVSLHWLGLPTREAREALAELQRTMSGPNQLAVRVSFALPEFDGAHPLAGASPRGLFFILSDGGGAELGGSRRAGLGAEERTLALLANAGRRAILLRAEDGDASKLVAALRAAGQLLTP
jgi:hypothetical protein